MKKLGSLKLWVAAAFAVLVAGLLVLPTVKAPGGKTWSYQLPPKLEQAPFVAPAWGLVGWSTDRVRDVFRFNLLSWNASGALPVGATGPAVRQAFTVLLAGALLLLIWSRRGRAPAFAAVLGVLFLLHLVAAPARTFAALTWPSEAIPRVAAELVVAGDTGQKAGTKAGREAGIHSLSDRYHREFVTFTQVRMGKAGTVGADLKRLWFGLSGFAYVLPFSIAIVVLAMATTVLQAVSLLLMLFGLLAVPARLTGRLSPYTFAHHWLRPLIASHVALFLGSVATLWAMLAAINVHAAENEVFVLAAGSTVPVGMAVLFWLLVVRKALRGVRSNERRSPLPLVGDTTRPLPAGREGGPVGHGGPRRWRVRR